MNNRAFPGKREPMSKIRKAYFVRLVGRCVVWVLCALLCFYRPGNLRFYGA